MQLSFIRKLELQLISELTRPEKSLQVGAENPA